MRRTEPGTTRAGDSGWDRGWDGHFRRQVRRGLELTPAERLRWLEQTMEELRGWVGRARRGTRKKPDS